MPFFVKLLVFIIFVIILSIFYKNKQIIKQCDDYIKAIYDKDGNYIEFPDKISGFFAFIRKNGKVIGTAFNSDYEFKKRFETFSYRVEDFIKHKLRVKEELLYKEKLGELLTQTVKDKKLKQQIIEEIAKNYLPEIQNNESDHFVNNLLNNFVHKGNSVDGEYIGIGYPKIFTQINTLCLQYINENTQKKDDLIAKLQKIGQTFVSPMNKKSSTWLEERDIYTTVEALQSDLYPKTRNDILDYLAKEKVIDSKTVKEYKSIFDGTYDKKKAEKLKEIFGEKYSLERHTDDNIGCMYVKHIIEHGNIDDYLWLSDKLCRLLFRVDSPDNSYGPKSRHDWLIAHKKMLDACIYGINPLLLFKPKDFKGVTSYGDAIKTEPIINLKQDIDSILSSYYPVPNFLNHAKEILDAYITGNTFCEKAMGSNREYEAWHDNYNRKLYEIKLSELSPYECFGFSIGYLQHALDLNKRSTIKIFYKDVKDSAFRAYLKSMDEEIFDNDYNYYWEYIKTIEQQNSFNVLFKKHE